MNSLSWLLYGINIIDNLGLAFKWFLAISVISSIVATLFTWVKGNEYGNRKIDFETSKKPWAFSLLFTAFLALIAALFPSQRTLYLMAASEIGQRVMTNEKVAGLVDPSIEVLQNYVKLENIKIRKELNKLTKKDDD